MKKDIDLVGYGYTVRACGGGKPVWVGDGTRMQAPAQLSASARVMMEVILNLVREGKVNPNIEKLYEFIPNQNDVD